MKVNWKIGRFFLFFFVVGGCSISSPQSHAGGDPQMQELYPAEQEKGDAERLAQLRKLRKEDAFAPSFALGPGDVLTISEPDLKELNQHEVRVSANNTITLPLIGVINVSGMTEDQLRGALQVRLAVYVKDPQVDVLVKEYHTRQVAVLGMVRQPGLYTLASRSETVQDVLGRAGGMTEDASSRILFVPTNWSGNSSDMTKVSSAMTVLTGNEERVQRIDTVKGDVSTQTVEKPEAAEGPNASRAEVQPALSKSPESILNADPIVIDLTGVNGTAELDLPARPGDLLIVPAAGEVMVDGWVKTPGAYKISNGMTALGAVSAAGGAMFSSTVVVLRTNPDKTKTAFHLDLSKVKSGAQADIPIQASDVVFVQQSVIGAVPYGLYALFQRFGTGIMLPF
jgi:protein involved in polysaccharide export with SLBB domain